MLPRYIDEMALYGFSNMKIIRIRKKEKESRSTISTIILAYKHIGLHCGISSMYFYIALPVLH